MIYYYSINTIKIISRLLANIIYLSLGGSMTWGFIELATDSTKTGWLLFFVAAMLLTLFATLGIILHVYLSWRDKTWGCYMDENSWL